MRSAPVLKSLAKAQLKGLDGDEAGVHGGAYSVRPDEKESMIFLRKLRGGSPSLMSPLDSPMRKFSEQECPQCQIMKV